MTLKEMKSRTLSLIEEVNPDSPYLTDDIDIKNKINYTIDIVNHDLAKLKKIAAIEKVDVKEGQEMDLYKELKSFFQLKNVENVTFDRFENILTFKEDGTATIKYYKYPKMITDVTKDDEYKFETSIDVQEIMPLKIAHLLLINDVAAQYGRQFANAYDEVLKMLDTRTSQGSATIRGGFNV